MAHPDKRFNFKQPTFVEQGGKKGFDPNSIPIGTGTFGEITRKLLDKWSKNLNVDIEKQIRDWDKVNSTTPNAPTPYQFKTKI